MRNINSSTFNSKQEFKAKYFLASPRFFRMRQSLEFNIENPQLFKSQLLRWSSKHEKLCFLNSNAEANFLGGAHSYSSFDMLLGLDSIKELRLNAGSAFEQVKEFYETTKDWLLGYWGYDLKNEIEKLSSQNSDELQFPDLHFFQPKLVFILRGSILQVEFFKEFSDAAEIKNLVEEVHSIEILKSREDAQKIEIEAKVSQEEYLKMVHELKLHIQRGDIYELNYCIEFFVKKSQLNCVQLYEDLNAISQTPFSCFYRNENNFLLCASPERFMKKQATKLISQPIKGTRKRGKDDADDQSLKADLAADLKERSENVMIVDLVRNDLSRSAKRGTVKVDELFGLYTFKQVHQLISTISCELNEELHFVDALKNAFPMGSMTGAPKVRAMQLIEEFESSKRGLYSGAVGYISPAGDFDFNVVIRSLLHNANSNYTSLMVGSAITANSDAQKEYEECLVKAAALFKVLRGNSEN